MIFSLFGPDGVGKTTLAQKSADLGYPTLNGTRPASWPDTSWHESFEAIGVDEQRIRDYAHFIEKMRRSHALAHLLNAEHGRVVFDSDPMHKIQIHTMMGGQAVSSINELWGLVGPVDQATYNHVHVRVSRSLDDDLRTQAQMLQDRLQQRGDLSVFDPTSTDASERMIEASLELEDYMRTEGHIVKVAYSDEPDDFITMLDAK